MTKRQYRPNELDRAPICGVLLALALALLPARAAGATEVNTCGQVYSGSGFLSGDLDCTGFGGDAVTIEGGSLDLQGFTLTGGIGDGIRCTKSCRVVSDPPGGIVVGAAGIGVFVNNPSPTAGASLRMQDVVVDGNGTGVQVSFGGAAVFDSAIMNSVTAFGVGANSLRLVRSTVTGNMSNGAGGIKVRVVDSDVTGNLGIGLDATRATVKRSIISGNGQEGIDAVDRAKVVDSTISNNDGTGIDASGSARVSVVRSEVSMNGGQGIFVGGGSATLSVKETTISGNALEGIRDESAERTKVVKGSVITSNGLHGVFTTRNVPLSCRQIVRDSTVTGNGTDPDCGVVVTCADLAACEPPNIGGVTCDTSYDTLSGFPGTSWGICSLD